MKEFFKENPEGIVIFSIILGISIMICSIIVTVNTTSLPSFCDYSYNETNVKCMRSKELTCMSDYYGCLDMAGNEYMCQEQRYKCLAR